MTNESIIIKFIERIEHNMKSILIRDNNKNVALVDLPTDLAIKVVCEMVKKRLRGEEVGHVEPVLQAEHILPTVEELMEHLPPKEKAKHPGTCYECGLAIYTGDWIIISDVGGNSVAMHAEHRGSK